MYNLVLGRLLVSVKTCFKNTSAITVYDQYIHIIYIYIYIYTVKPVFRGHINIPGNVTGVPSGYLTRGR